jgi:hypothetical protein
MLLVMDCVFDVWVGAGWLPWRGFFSNLKIIWRKAIKLGTVRTVIQVTEARLVNILTSTSLTSRSRIISALGRYNQKYSVIENEYIWLRKVQISALLLKRIDLTVNPAVEANNLAAAHYFYLKCLNCCSIRLFLYHAFRYSQASIISSPRWFCLGVMSFFVLLKTRSHSVDISGHLYVS